jgi:hypothetical protein
VLVHETFSELEILDGPFTGGVRESRAKRAYVLFIERVADPQILSYAPHELICDAFRAHRPSVRAGAWVLAAEGEPTPQSPSIPRLSLLEGRIISIAHAASVA